MPKTITVKGIGHVSAEPDLAVISMGLEARDMDYGKAMAAAEDNIGELNEAMTSVGFEKKALKTTGFNVRTEYDYRTRKDGSGERVFTGYVVEHNLKAEFGFEAERLTAALGALGACRAHPMLTVSFTVKDASAIKEELLRAASANARRKAEVLCEASGKTLGELVSIDYSFGDVNLFSGTRYSVAEDCMAPRMAKQANIEIAPDDIKVSDSATFVWEIL